MRAIKQLEQHLQNIITTLGYTMPAKVTIEPPKDKKFGDLAVNCALVLAKQVGKNPRELATEIAALLEGVSADIAKVEVAGPGFLNVTFSPAFWHHNVLMVEAAATQYGASTLGNNKKIQVEFVSANPTGPLHIGHGRGAAVGDSMVRILNFAGYNAFAEYYLNDAGNQMQTLGRSIWLRAHELQNTSTEPFPEKCYQGEYIIDIARTMLAEQPNLCSLPQEEGINACYLFGMNIILQGIKKDLTSFKVEFSEWFSEKSLVDDGSVAQTLALLHEKGVAYEQDGALWFRTTDLGDDKDRVLRKSDGSLTYFASDIAYHANKYSRGFEEVIDVWGADHHGYVPRLRACIQALGQEASAFDVILVQLVNLLKDGEQIAMSTRAGKFETLADVIEEVGVDAARFMFLSRKSDSKLDFDLALAKQRTMDNPVYYVQYAHARIQAVIRRAKEQGIVITEEGNLAGIIEEEALDLLRMLDRFPQVVGEAAVNHAPHYISFYLMELAGMLHKYYSVHQVLRANSNEQIVERLRLMRAVGVVICNGLSLLGVSAPESM